MQPNVPPLPQRTRVGVLVPLTGSNAALGRAMLNAAQLALFEGGDASMELMPEDTRSTPAGAAEAARAALAGGARILVGPLTNTETGAVAQTVRPSAAPVLAFTSDGSQAGGSIWALGITPAQQVQRVAAAAIGRGARHFALAAPEGEFGRRLAAALQESLAGGGLEPPAIAYYSPRGGPETALRSLASRAGLTPPAPPATPAAAEADPNAPLTAPLAAPLAPPPPLPPLGTPYDAILIGDNGSGAARVAAGLSSVGINPPVQLLGTALWNNDPGLGNSAALIGAWFPGPDQNSLAQFENRYQAAFGERPPALAAISYDAAGIAVRAARGGTVRDPGTGELFLGADGPIRVLPNGQVQRGLAVFEVRAGSPTMVEPATAPGQIGY